MDSPSGALSQINYINQIKAKMRELLEVNSESFEKIKNELAKLHIMSNHNKSPVFGTQQEPQLVLIDSATINIAIDSVATEYIQRNVNNGPFKYEIMGHVADSSGLIMRDSLRRSCSGDHVNHVADELIKIEELDIKATIDAPCLFAGHFMSHYGHFITEGLSRLYCMPDAKYFHKIVFYPFIFDQKPSSCSLKDYHVLCFEALGIPIDKIYFIDGITHFKELWVPAPGWSINSDPSPFMRNLYNTIHRKWLLNLASQPSKIFICRRSGSTCRSDRFEEIEKLFEVHGFIMITPEEMPFDDQIRYFANADCVAGFSGSGLHNVVFCKNGVKLIEILDSRSLKHPLRMQLGANRISYAVHYVLEADIENETINSFLKAI